MHELFAMLGGDFSPLKVFGFIAFLLVFIVTLIGAGRRSE